MKPPELSGTVASPASACGHVCERSRTQHGQVLDVAWRRTMQFCAESRGVTCDWTGALHLVFTSRRNSHLRLCRASVPYTLIKVNSLPKDPFEKLFPGSEVT